MKKLIHTAKTNPLEVIVPTILGGIVITFILCLTVFSNGIYIPHF
jgi:hypothetical protein